MSSVAKPLIAERDGYELEYREEANPFNDLLQALGIICENDITITGGAIDPSVIGFVANYGSVYFSGNGNIYKKTGATDTDWVIFTGGSGNVPSGGLIDQVLMKLSNTDGDYDWRDENNNVDGGIF